MIPPMLWVFLFETSNEFFAASDKMIFRNSPIRETRSYSDEAIMLLMGGEL